MTEELLGSGRASDAVGEAGLVRDRTAIRALISAVIRDAKAALIGRDDAARSLVLSVLSGQPAALVGPPGTAKTALVRAVLARVEAPVILASIDPVTGQFSSNDAGERAMDRPHFVFIEDGLDAQGPALAQVRSWVEHAPSTCVIATALCAEDAEPALFDRFVVRVEVSPLDDKQFAALLSEPRVASAVENRVSIDVLQAIRDGAQRVTLDPVANAALVALRRGFLEREVLRSERWWLDALSVLRVAVFVDGRDEIELDDLLLLAAMFATDGDVARGVLRAWLAREVHGQSETIGTRLHTALAALSAAVDGDQAARTLQRDASGAPLFRTPDGRTTTEPKHRVERRTSAGERLFVRPKDRPRVGTHDEVTARELFDRYFLGRVSELKAYTEDPRNMAWDEVANEPLTVPTLFDEAHIDRRIEWLATIALDLRDARAMCARIADSSNSTTHTNGSIWNGGEWSPSDRSAAVVNATMFDSMIPSVSSLRARIASLPVKPR